MSKEISVSTTENTGCLPQFIVKLFFTPSNQALENSVSEVPITTVVKHKETPVKLTGEVKIRELERIIESCLLQNEIQNAIRAVLSRNTLEYPPAFVFELEHFTKSSGCLGLGTMNCIGYRFVRTQSPVSPFALSERTITTVEVYCVILIDALGRVKIVLENTLSTLYANSDNTIPHIYGVFSVKDKDMNSEYITQQLLTILKPTQ